MNQDDELTPRFNEFGARAMASTVPAGSEAVRGTVRRRHRVRALAAGALTVAVLALGGMWLGPHLGRSSGPPAAYTTAGVDAPTSAPAPSSAVAPRPGAGPEAGASASSSPGEGAPGGGGSAAVALPRCHTADLDVRLEASPGGGAAGSVYLDLGLTNHSPHPCGVYGFPGMTLIDSAGRWLPTTLRRDSTLAALVRLAPGQTGWALVHYTHLPADDETMPCQPAAVGLVVTPPDETTQLTVNTRLDDVCQHGQLATSAMRAQRSGG
ncbi:MAG: hypothetical protein JWP76_4623 [Dactylosporangium sp.]|nr:hypothetical protein [Dactylosporangium sp.]